MVDSLLALSIPERAKSWFNWSCSQFLVKPLGAEACLCCYGISS